MDVDLDCAMSTWPGCRRRGGLDVQEQVKTRSRSDAMDGEKKVEAEDKSIVSEICSALVQKGEGLRREIQEMRAAEQTCAKTLTMLRREQAMWHEKLCIVRTKMAVAKKQMEDAQLMLTLHRTLQTSGVDGETVRSLQKLLSHELPKDVQKMVGDCLNTENGLDVGACLVCDKEFTDDALQSVETNRNCRHNLYPCRHAVLCGSCARELWATTRICPVCNVTMTKKPKMFKPGRQG
ncbi:hypothetical protein BSKO_10355 [Bryopsis sp. KO-2023]|nr:hypothetical protein BSKO_10355 [Bryopsis sp. KO-2023]